MIKKFLIGACGALMLVACNKSVEKAEVVIDRAVMVDKVKGAWAGKMIGVMYGRPMEFACNDRMYTDSIHWAPENVVWSLNEDDIYGQMCFMSTMERIGLDAPIDSLAHDFAYAKFALCHANLQGRKNYLDGLRGKEISMPKNNIHCDDIDFQIECDFIGFINPLMPASSDAMCERVGAVMSAGDGLYAGMYVSALHALAYGSNDIEGIVAEALKAIPAESGYARLVNEVLECYRANPDDWTEAWTMLNEKYGPYDVCTPYLPFNIDAKLNGGYIVTGLLYGGGDWKRTMDITVGCGQDTDCNTSNAAAVLGVMQGYEAIPQEYKSHIPEIADECFAYTTYSFNKAVEQTLVFMEQSIRNNGGTVTDSSFVIKPQNPVAPAFEPGHQDIQLGGMFAVSQPEYWHFEGNWEDFVYGNGDEDPYKKSTTPGDKMEIEFEGTGVAILGGWDTDGGCAVISIDGKEYESIDTYYVAQVGKYQGNRAYLFFTTGLEDGKHTLMLENQDRRNPASTGNSIYIERVLIYK